LIRNANSVWLNGRALGADLERVLGRRLRRDVAADEVLDWTALEES
jgi:hypothetical protein